VNSLNAHSIGANSVSWAPYSDVISAAQGLSPSKTFASGGCDNLIKLWNFDQDNFGWKLDSTLSAHSDWVRDVAFSSSGILASCGQDRHVFVWRKDASIFAIDKVQHGRRLT
jgi:protein transport protein SEC13